MTDSSTEVPVQPDRENSLIERTIISALLGSQNKRVIDNPEYNATLPMIKGSFRESWAWHGTGRLQYDPKDRGNMRDVLATIIAEGGLIPHTDVLDFTNGEMESISTSPIRLYSLMYAQCHFEKGLSFFNHTQNGLIWAYYLAPMAFKGAIEALVKRNPDYMKMLDRDTRAEFAQAAAGFHDKYTKTRASKYEMTTGGLSDISGNYPILIGLRQGSFQPTEIARLIDQHEMRARTPIMLKDFTHIEVPEVRVNEVTEFLRQHNISIPVYAIEWGNEYAKTLPLRTTLENKI